MGRPSRAARTSRRAGRAPPAGAGFAAVWRSFAPALVHRLVRAPEPGQPRPAGTRTCCRHARPRGAVVHQDREHHVAAYVYSSLSAVRAEAVVQSRRQRAGGRREGRRGAGAPPRVETVPSQPPRDPIGAADVRSPMADLPVGATFGSLVHAVLEHVDPRRRRPPRRGARPHRRAARLVAGRARPRGAGRRAGRRVRLTARRPRLVAVGGHPARRPTDRPVARDGLRDRRWPAATYAGRRARRPANIHLGDLAPLLERHLPEGDPVRAYAEALRGPLGDQPLRGYLTGSVDVVLRVPTPGGPRFHVVDYKTNWLGPIDEPLTAAAYRPEALDAAMGHSDYPLQALLYATVLHRFLRWRLPGYDPERHLGEVLYLYVRGMCGPDTPDRRRGPVRRVHLAGARAARRRALRPPRREGGTAHDRALRADRRARLAAGPRAQRRAGRSAGRVQRRAAADGRRPPRRRPGRCRSAARTTNACCWRWRLAVRAVRRGSVCLSLDDVRGGGAGAALAGRGGVGRRRTPLHPGGRTACCGGTRHRGGLLYLDRYHRMETQVRDDLVARVHAAAPGGRRGPARPRRCGGCAASTPATQQVGAAEAAVRRWTTIVTGGPGTGKTTTVARMLALLADQAVARGVRLSVALTAPTGKAASRLQEAVSQELAKLQRRAGGRRPARSPAGRDPAPPAGLAARQHHPVPPRPRPTGSSTTWSSSTSPRWSS